jgi:hypothetical protein
MTIRWIFVAVSNAVFGPTLYPGKRMAAVHVGPDGHDKIPVGQGCNECGWINVGEES